MTRILQFRQNLPDPLSRFLICNSSIRLQTQIASFFVKCKFKPYDGFIPNELYRDTIRSSINKTASNLELHLNFSLARNYIMMHELCYLFTFLFSVFPLLTFHACVAIALQGRQM